MSIFPIINTIDDVLWAIEGRDEFFVSDKGDFTIINYIVNKNDTFLDPDEIGISIQERLARQIRRECRGITFCNKTKKIIRRPLNKFFNVSEKVETQIQNLDFTTEHYVDEKIDGSFICPFFVNNEIFWGTKMAAEDFHYLVQRFVDDVWEEDKINYIEFCRELINYGYSPIFEFTHPEKRIVIDYGREPLLTFLAVRNMVTGEYLDLDKTWAIDYGIPVVRSRGKIEDPEKFMEYVHTLKNEEGFVIRWKSGYRVKVKAYEYVMIHKAKEAILFDRNIVEIILEEKLDDIKANLSVEENINLTRFEEEINNTIIRVAGTVLNTLLDIAYNEIDRKTFALEIAPTLDPYIRPIVFKNFSWEDVEPTKIFLDVRDKLRDNVINTKRYEEIRSAWFPHVYYN